MAQVKTVRTHSSYSINLVAEPMEPIHAELFRLATELEAVKGQVQTECNALRDLHHVSERKREASALAQSAKCATIPIRHLCQVKALITHKCMPETL